MSGTVDPWYVSPDEFPDGGSVEEQAAFLLNFAILAPSSHNSQPWTFAIDGDQIDVFADRDRWLTVADPDRRELHLSVGCALENLLVAAAHYGFDPRVSYRPEADGDDPVARVTLRRGGTGDGLSEPRPTDWADLFDAITERTTNHGVYADEPLPEAFSDRLADCVADEPVDLTLVTGESIKRAIARLQTRADEAQMADPEYRRELGYWIGTGALGANWLMARVGQLAVTYLDLGRREGAKNSKLIESAAAIAVLTTASPDVESRVRAGQAFERMALVAASEGVAVHPASQTLERPEFRRELVETLDLGEAVPQHLFRLGFAEQTPEHTPRRPVADVRR